MVQSDLYKRAMRIIYGDRLIQAIYKKLDKLESHINKNSIY